MMFLSVSLPLFYLLVFPVTLFLISLSPSFHSSSFFLFLLPYFSPTVCLLFFFNMSLLFTFPTVFTFSFHFHFLFIISSSVCLSVPLFSLIFCLLVGGSSLLFLSFSVKDKIRREMSLCLSGRTEFGGHAEEASDPGAGGGGLRRHRPPAVQHQPGAGGCWTPRQVRWGTQVKGQGLHVL